MAEASSHMLYALVAEEFLQLVNKNLLFYFALTTL